MSADSRRKKKGVAKKNDFDVCCMFDFLMEKLREVSGLGFYALVLIRSSRECITHYLHYAVEPQFNKPL